VLAVRIINSIINDIKFQFKYGFYLVYLIITMTYLGIVFAMPTSFRQVASAIIVFSDPAALGFFFMGAIVLFEKSERVLNSLFISPLKIDEYIFSKIFSLGVVSTIVGVAITIITSPEKANLLSLIIGLMLGSMLFSLAGLIVATKVNSLNGFMVGVIPIGTFLSMPPFLIFFGIHYSLLNLHPGAIILEYILHGVGIGKINFFSVVLLMLWMAVFWLWARINLKKAICNLGGTNL
jgi:fluoroquinolone transport system permease protein